jgi:hypothetical protein
VITQLVTHAGEEQAPPKRVHPPRAHLDGDLRSWGSEGRSVAQKLMAHVMARALVRSCEGAWRHGESCSD